MKPNNTESLIIDKAIVYINGKEWITLHPIELTSNLGEDVSSLKEDDLPMRLEGSE